ncbi:MAG: SRPBCC family protein [Vicinamibacteria bacterium]
MATMALEEYKGPLTNVGDLERVGSALAGAAMVLAGLNRGTLAGRGVALAGAGLVARGFTGRCPMYEAMGRESVSYRHPVRVVEQMVVGVPPQKAYDAWRDLARLPRFMKHVKSVTVENDTSHWVAEFSGLPTIEWDAVLVKDEPGKVISWRSKDDAQPIENAGSVTFFDLGDRGTGLRVEIGYYPPAGALGRTVARLFGPVTEQQVREDVRRFKSLLEAGEIPTTEGQPTGKGRTEVAR